MNAKGLFGSADKTRKLIACYQGNPLALKIVASAILELFDGKISPFIQQETTVFNGIRRVLEQQRRASFTHRSTDYVLPSNS